MESNFNREFEQFVKQNADQYRMFPSDKVWKGVHNALHTRRRWYGIGLAFLLLMTGGAVTLVMKSYPTPRKQDAATIPGHLTYTPAESRTSAAISQNIEDILPFDGLPAGHNESRAVIIPFDNSVTDVSTTRVQAPETIISQDNRTATIATIPVFRTERNDQEIVNRPGLDQVAVRPEMSPVVVAQATPKSLPLPLVAPVNLAQRATAQPELLSMEDLAMNYKAPKKRLTWQVFVTPTISYRRLQENKSFSGSPDLVYPFASLSDVNNAVTHKPDMGLQLGFSARYPVTKNFRALAGIQFNINRYDIKAFSNAGELAVINLDGGGPANTVNTWTYYRSQTGYRSDWLKNYYFSVSVPIGAEVQSYIVKDRAYLISTDYKNYAEVPSLVRRVNVSTGFEAFVNYSKGNTRWQIGPQVRYQLLSSFHNAYPVKENLFDFGMKIGVTLNQ
jgi:hypothetical protein